MHPDDTSPAASEALSPQTDETAPATPRPPPEIPEELLDPDAVKVVRRLRRAGHAAYLVGGCVRDSLLGLHPKDYDVATSAHPHQVKETFRNCRLIGRRFRLAHVYFRGGKVIEVSTFRANPLDELADLPQDLLIRHDNVFGNEEEDAKRRDFTVNGLFYDVDEGKVVDHVNGKADLAARLIRTIGNPDVRMREDPVRILRAIRFAAKCGCEVEAETWAAMKAHAHEIPRCAPPRVLEELLKLMRSSASKRCLELLREVGALRILVPPIASLFEERPEELGKQLRALDALDAHVKVGEVPSDSVLLATLLAPLPRQGAPRGPIPKAPPRGAASEAVTDQPEGLADADVGPGVTPGEPSPAPAVDPDEIDPDLLALSRELSSEGTDEDDEDEGDDEGDDTESDEEGDDDEDEPGAGVQAGEPIAAPPEPAPAEASGEAGNDPSGAAPAAGALRIEEVHDARLGGIPAFSTGGDSQPWSLPQGVVPPELVLTEMVRTARLPRRIAERTRLILSVQPILGGERKKRRFSTQSFARQSIFPEALAVYELSVAASGRGAENLARWQQVFNGQPLAVEPEPLRREGPGSDADRKHKRRRRRGGRGRKRNG